MERSTVGSILRATQAFCLQLCEKETLDYGIAYYSARFPKLPEANEFREVMLQDIAALPSAFAQAENWFSEHGLVCHRWAPADGCDHAAMAAFLGERGFRRDAFHAMHLVAWAEVPAQPEIRVLPARAMRAALRAVIVDDLAPASREQRELLADAYAERLDDPQFDVFVAVHDGKPVGRCGLYQVGDIARVMDLRVLSDPRHVEVKEALLSQVLTMARRLAFANVCAQSDVKDAEFLQRYGFIKDGEIVEYERERSR